MDLWEKFKWTELKQLGIVAILQPLNSGILQKAAAVLCKTMKQENSEKLETDKANFLIRI